ncbi:S8 family serine peptidase, partial [candidate division WOR-3 bacterium]|nr:S8 family serine peptidase [candidate division WOR-3 bacterium]
MTKRVLTLALALAAVSLAWPDLTRPAVTGTDGELHTAGQVIIELVPGLRGQVRLSEADGIAFFGVPALDELSIRWGVDEIAPLMRHPEPSEIARAYGCDLQYLVQFRVDQDIAPVMADYEATGLVDYACPNALMALDELPDDPELNRQWHIPTIGAAHAWGVAKGDTNVANCVIDDGCDWKHPDIEANLWINHPEDINGNGRFDSLYAPDGDLDGIDQDGNGYADDVIGFNFVYGTPNPMPQNGDDHGTHCWGNINAVTNNATGVAGVTWNSRSVAVCCGGGGFVNLSAAISSIYYGVPLGVWAFSMSFGGNSPYPPMRDACGSAWSSGSVLYGSAGNEGGELVRYPANYDGVENVAASSSGDMKAGFSNYGTWVDVTAPGDGIYATYTRYSGSYGSMSGTSMSCPMAAGVAAWMKSFEPTMSNVACTARMHAACDSMPDPLYAQGKLGAGRVSMANVVLPLY